MQEEQVREYIDDFFEKNATSPKVTEQDLIGLAEELGYVATPPFEGILIVLKDGTVIDCTQYGYHAAFVGDAAYWGLKKAAIEHAGDDPEFVGAVKEALDEDIYGWNEQVYNNLDDDAIYGLGAITLNDGLWGDDRCKLVAEEPLTPTQQAAVSNFLERIIELGEDTVPLIVFMGDDRQNDIDFKGWSDSDISNFLRGLNAAFIRGVPLDLINYQQ